MRTFADFVRVRGYYTAPQIIGKVVDTRYGSSCALSSYFHLKPYIEGGIQLAEFTQKPTEKVATKNKCYKLFTKHVKLRNGNYLAIEALQFVGKNNPSASRQQLTRTEYSGAQANSILSVRFNQLAYVADNILNRDWRGNNKATKQELVAIRKEIRTLVKGKDITCIVEFSDYYNRQLEKIQKAFGLFKKKPKVQFNFNNTIHPRKNDYLTFQLYRY